MAKLLSLQNLSVLKPPLLKDISFEMEEGEIICILGANGSGKSTLLRAVLGQFDYKGKMLLKGYDSARLSVKKRARILSYVPQNYTLALPYNVLEVVLMGSYLRQIFFYSTHDRKKAQESLELLGILDLAHQKFSTLSGGQKQLVLIARALCQESELILLDEPVSALDLGHCFRLLEVLSTIKKSILLTSHHPEHCFIAHKIIALKNASILGFGTAHEILNEECLSKLYDTTLVGVDLPFGGSYFCPPKV